MAIKASLLQMICHCAVATRTACSALSGAATPVWMGRRHGLMLVPEVLVTGCLRPPRFGRDVSILDSLSKVS